MNKSQVLHLAFLIANILDVQDNVPTMSVDPAREIVVDYYGYDPFPVLPGMPDVVMDNTAILDGSTAAYGLRVAADDSATACEVWDNGRYGCETTLSQRQDGENIYFRWRNHTGEQLFTEQVLPAVIKTVLTEASFVPARH